MEDEPSEREIGAAAIWLRPPPAPATGSGARQDRAEPGARTTPAFRRIKAGRHSRTIG
jgi:hypothetical protein